MNNRALKYNIIKFVCFFLTATLYQQISGAFEIWGIVPNPVFLLILAAAIAEEQTELFYPCVFGIIYDYMNGIVFGVYTLLFVLISFFTSELYHKNFENVTLVEILFVMLGCFLYSFITAAFIALMDGGFWSVVLRISLPEFLYNFIAGVVILLIYKKIISAPAARRRSRHRSAWRV